MHAGLRALLESVIDYAGLFPPAQLPLDTAIRSYARYRQEPEAWMLGRFVLPGSRFSELQPYVQELFGSGPPLGLVALGRQAETVTDWLAGLRSDAKVIADCPRQYDGRVRVDSYEVRLPQEAVQSADSERLSSCLAAVRDLLGPLPAFFEAGPAANDPEAASRVLVALAQSGLGYKLRCGGLTAAAFPSAQVIAFTLRACHKSAVPLKLTAGLHHPLPSRDAGVGATMHGFVNVLTAGVLAATGARQDTLIELLQDTDAGHFAFNGGLRWKEHSASAEQITATRQSRVLSLGSCSFEEPRDDLRALGWL